MSTAAAITIEVVREAIAHMRAYALSTWSDSDGEFYIFSLPSSRAQEAFDMGLAPFCVLGPLRGHVMATYP